MGVDGEEGVVVMSIYAREEGCFSRRKSWGGGRVMPGEERVNCQRTELVMQRGRC